MTSKSKEKIAITGINRYNASEVEFESLCEAGRNGFNPSAISRCLSGHRISHKDYLWIRRKKADK